IGGCINDGSVALLGVEDPLKLYLLYFLHSQTVTLRAINQGAAQPNLNTTIVRSICVPLPPRAEQNRIIEAIEKCLSVEDNLVAGATKEVDRVERLRQAILKFALEGRLVDQAPTDEPASVLLERIKAKRAASQPATKQKAGRSRRRTAA